MKVVCPSCHQSVDGNDIDLATSRAVCRPCGEVISLGGPMPEAPLPRPPRPTDLRAELTRDGDRLVLRVTPSRLAAIGTLVFATVWCGFLFVWYSKALAHPSPSNIALWFPVLHVAVGVYMAWSAARGLLNTTTLTLDRRTLVVAEGPVPAGGACNEGTPTLVKFTAARRARKLRGRGTPTSDAVLNVVTQDGRALCLAFRLSEDQHAEWLAAELNDHLLDVQRPPEPSTYRG